jgi:polysaccharide transporter, PST family
MRRHLADASWLFAADIAARALNFLAVAWLARTLEPALYGTVVIGASVLDYALLLCDWGLKTLGTRETARPERLRRFQPRTIAAARLLLSLAVFTAANVALSLLSVEPTQAMLIRIYLLGLLPYALLVDWYHQGRGTFAVITIGRAAGSLLLVAGAFALVRTPEHAARVPWLYVGSMAATSLVMLVAALGTRERLLPDREDLAAAPAVLRGSTALGVAALFGQTFIALPPIIAGRALGSASAGVLYAALRIVMIVLIIDRVFGTLYLPALTRAWEADRGRVPERLEAAFRVVTVLGVGASTVCMIFAADLVRLAFGERYVDAASVLVALAPFIAATLVNTFFAYGLIAIGQERLYLRSGMRSGVLFVILLLVATPLFGLRGTALAMVIGESVMTLLLFAEFRRHIPLRPLRPLVVSIAVGAGLLLAARSIDASALWQAPLYAAAFAAAVLLLRGVTLDDMRAPAR